MHGSSLRLATTLLVLVGSATVAFADERPHVRSLRVEGVTEHFEVRYLPEWRYTGNAGERGDTEMTLDVFVPPGDGPFPTVVYVHGGGYGGGSKRFGGDNAQLARRLLDEGFVVVSLNYILQKKGIFPQVWWDFHDSIRFLRREAKTYRVDPLRVGAYGISAGGWLISSASVGNGDLLRVNNGNAVTTHDLRARGWRMPVKNPDHHDNWLRPMRSPAPGWAGVHGGVSALAFDFDHHLRFLKPHNPPVQKWVGAGYQPKFWEAVVEAGVDDRVELAQMTAERFRGKAVHVPPFYGRDAKRAPEALARTGDGPEQPLGELVVDFFRRNLVEDHRLPTPEIHPSPRVFEETVEVSLVGPPGSTVHYTTDGSEPNEQSPVFEKGFRISKETVVKAFATHPDHRRSGTNVARFVTGPEAPRVTGPKTLPPGRTGKPYELRFTSDAEEAHWLMQGDLVPFVTRSGDLAFPNGMAFDGETGRWHGTPWRPGRYWVQVWVNRGPGTLAGYRDFVWEVTGDELPGQAWEARATADDQNVELARLSGWHPGFVRELTARFQRRGVKAIVVEESDDRRLVLVDAADRGAGRRCLESVVARHRGLVDRVEYASAVEGGQPSGPGSPPADDSK